MDAKRQKEILEIMQKTNPNSLKDLQKLIPAMQESMDFMYQEYQNIESKIAEWEAAARAPDLRSAPTLLSRRLRDSATAEVGFLHAKLLINAAEEIERLASAAPVEALTDEEIFTAAAIAGERYKSLAAVTAQAAIEFARAIEARIMGGAK